MNKISIIPLLLASMLSFAACHEEPNQGNTAEPDAPGTITYTESDKIFPNPERGFHVQVSYKSGDSNTLSASTMANLRNTQSITLLLTMYYLNDYKECDIPDSYLQRLETNMKALRNGGGKCILRFAYSSTDANSARPWDATQEQVARHIEQLTPYLQEFSDVILCLQAGFVGSWGEWYYTDYFNFNPSKDEDYEPRNNLLRSLLNAMPKDRMVCVRTPIYKMKYLGISYADTLTEATAFTSSDIARIAGHNDCFLASANDVGTYSSNLQRTYWEHETRYTLMGGETCGTSYYSTGENAVEQMAKYHWTYINRDYHKEVLTSWTTDGHMDEIKRRLGYRLVLTKGWFTQEPEAGKSFEAKLKLKNVGFAAPVNPRDVQLVFVSQADTTKKVIVPLSNVEPRRWFAGGEYALNVNYTLPADMSGNYNLYLNLPDPKPTLANNPEFSIRLANNDMWDESTGYNKLCTITIK